MLMVRARSRESFTCRAVDRGDDVTRLDAGLGGRAAVLRIVDHRALGLLQAEAVGDIGRHRLHLDAEPAARDVALVLELGDDELRGGGGNVEADADRAARRREDRGVHADHIAVHVERRTAGIALVDRRVDLDVVVIGPGADIAAARRNDSGRHGAAETERIADGNHPIADARRLIGELHVGEVLLAVDLDQREVGLLVGADHLGRIDRAVIGRDLDRFGMVDHVIVGHRIAVRRDEEARAFAGDDLMLALHAVGTAEAELPEELFERRTGLFVIVALGHRAVVAIFIDLDADRYDRGFDLGDEIGEARGGLRRFRPHAPMRSMPED